MIEVSASRLTAIIIVFVWLGGCARSQLTNYYLLRSIQSPGAEVQTMGPEQGTVIGVGPVKIAEYLDRPQMVTRSSGSGVQFAEFDRWAEPLDKNLTRVLADNLSVMLPSQHVFVYPWAQSTLVQYQITLEILHFEKTPEGKAMLEASWGILRRDKLLVMKHTKLLLSIESAGFEGIASAESRAVEELSREIADAVKSLHRDAA